ncbi:MAG: hypothetical protein ACRD3E_04255 [Terriglobales bacterium]
MGGPPQTPTLHGWKAIAEYLSQPASTVQRWAKQGMPVHRDGRSVVADSAELNAWLGKESHAAAPVTIAAKDEDLMADLRRGVSAVKRRK